MNILLISQCDKRALTETRRILDQFAERRGDRVWQTPITEAGLGTLRRLLRKTARKNTAVACHWLRGRDHSELMWIVGDASRFNAQGAVPTNSTRRDVLRSDDENDWLHGEDIHLITALAALFHDLGKACAAFQTRLRSTQKLPANLYRHEWVSLRLLQAFIGHDDDATWLARLQDPKQMDGELWQKKLNAAKLRDGYDDAAADNKPFADQMLPPLAAAIAWLIVTHHRLPVPPRGETISADLLQKGLQGVDSQWNQTLTAASKAEAKPYWTFPRGLPVDDKIWREQVARLAAALAKRQAAASGNWLENPYVMHISRLLLMLADHHFSSQIVKQSWKKSAEAGIAFANTLKDDPERHFNQTLNEHLLGVARHSQQASRALPDFERHLPRLARHRILQQRSQNERFRWQDKAYELACSLRDKARQHGAFIVNMASTGCGKTLGNARVMYGLSDPAIGMRCAFALGLRTLTLQTGQAFRDKLKLDDGDLAIRVGGAASRELFEHYQAQAEETGSESKQTLLDETNHVRFDGNPDHPLLARLTQDNAVQAMLAAPVLVCTIDHLIPATESERGGRQIAPMLRLMSSDLALDEPDDFSIEDLPALTRLVHWAGLLGSRVLLSSATLPPALVGGLFDAYLAGRQHYQRSRGQPGLPLNISCAWLDERDTHSADCADSAAFTQAHQQFASRRYAWLASQPVRRTAELLPLSGIPRNEREMYDPLAIHLRDTALRLHHANAETDPASGKRVSFGLIRLANIGPLYQLAQALYRQGAPDGVRIHLCVYHSQYPLLLRSAIERRLDAALDRTTPEAVFKLPDIRQRLDAHSEPEQIFIVLGSPVTEVGRDHDYSWAIAEPSSMRSLIQLAGRVRRHRPQAWDKVNVLILEKNIHSLIQPGKPAYLRPGFEDEHDDNFCLTEHNLHQILQPEEYRHLDARPRLLAREKLNQKTSLVDLEHARLRMWMSGDNGQPRTKTRAGKAPPAPPINASSCWKQPAAMLGALLQRKHPFRLDLSEDVDLLLLPNEDEDDFALIKLVDGERRFEKKELVVDSSLHHRIADSDLHSQGITAWVETDYLTALQTLAVELDMPLAQCARRFGTVTLPASVQGWWFHPALGFNKKK
ncbi:CRISPR-associated helicase Cas3 [Chromobacterium vaccinii]|nr:CRISPR-associated helicase Cas3 [Chromobacterium vaccinii]QND92340.1 CRISPR-associated helicase Cas3 [Chromobacterium vaccinii]